MIDQLRALAIFGKTVECGSFRAAAKELGLSASVISHHISALEARLGTALLYRSTRRISLTSEGELLFASVQRMVEAANQGLDIVGGRSNDPSGRFCLTMPSFFARSEFIRDISAFSRNFPKVEIDIQFSDAAIDLVRNGIDMAIRVGDLKDSSLKSKKISSFDRKLVLAPSYLNTCNERINHPNKLKNLDWIGFQHRPHRKSFTHQKQGSIDIQFSPRLVVDSVDALAQFAIEGAGLATPPTFLIRDALSSEELVEVLPEWRVSSLAVYAVWPANASTLSIGARFLQFIEQSHQARSMEAFDKRN